MRVIPDDLVQMILKDPSLWHHPDLNATKHSLFCRSKDDIKLVEKEDASFIEHLLRNPEVIDNGGVRFTSGDEKQRLDSLRRIQGSIPVMAPGGENVYRIGMVTYEAVIYSGWSHFPNHCLHRTLSRKPPAKDSEFSRHVISNSVR